MPQKQGKLASVCLQRFSPIFETTIICVTHRVVLADLNFKQFFDSMSFRLGL